MYIIIRHLMFQMRFHPVILCSDQICALQPQTHLLHAYASRMAGISILERHTLPCHANCQVDRYPALFSPAKGSMQLFMRQPDVVGVAHFVMDLSDLLGAAPDAHDDGASGSDSSSSALAAG